jgi:hypothetical protein
MAFATCSALSEPLKESGAMTTTGADMAFDMVSRVLEWIEIARPVPIYALDACRKCLQAMREREFRDPRRQA